MDRNDSRPPPRRLLLDTPAKAAVVEGLAAGVRLAELAAACGVTTQALYKARRRDPLFDAGWRAAHAASAEAERREARERGVVARVAGAGRGDLRPGAGDRAGKGRWTPDQVRGDDQAKVRGDDQGTFPGDVQDQAGADQGRVASSDAFGGSPSRSGEDLEVGEERIVSNNRRLMQRRRLRHVRFDARRRAAFLAHFAWSCDTLAAAAEAGVSERTVYKHLRADGEFAAAFQAALEQGYVLLEAEAVRQRLAAQERLRGAVEASDGRAVRLATGDAGAEFDRVMKLLARWDRRDGSGPGRRAWRPSAARAWTFEEAIASLDRKLRALGLRRSATSPSTGT